MLTIGNLWLWVWTHIEKFGWLTGSFLAQGKCNGHFLERERLVIPGREKSFFTFACGQARRWLGKEEKIYGLKSLFEANKFYH